MKKLAKLAMVAAAVAGISAPAHAQAWNNTWSANNSGTPYWDNTSIDGTNCNIGDVVSGLAGTAGNACANQHPAGWLPYSAGAVPYNLLNGNSAVQFLFGAGTYSFSQAINSGGDITGNNGASERSWGYFTAAGGDVVMPFQSGDTFSNLVTFTSSWGLWIDRAPGTGEERYSNDNLCSGFFTVTCYPYHAVFSSAVTGLSTSGGVTTINAAVGNRFVVGMEDVSLIDGSDKDYNDVVVSFSRIDPNVQGLSVTTPEPSTYALMGAGLAALGFVARRRRNSIVA